MNYKQYQKLQNWVNPDRSFKIEHDGRSYQDDKHKPWIYIYDYTLHFGTSLESDFTEIPDLAELQKTEAKKEIERLSIICAA